MYLVKDPPYENLIHFDQTWQSKLWNDEKKKTAVQSQQTNFISNLYFNGTQTSTVMEIFHSWILNSISKKIDKKTTGNCFSPLSYIKINKH